MVINHTFEEQLRKLISEYQDELHNIEIQMKDLESKRINITEGLQACEITLRNYLRRIGQEPEQKPTDWDKVLSKCKTHRERIIAIARRNNGELKLSPATDILYNGKFIKSHARANAYLIVYGLINDMVDKRELEKVDRGIYRLTKGNRLL